MKNKIIILILSLATCVAIRSYLTAAEIREPARVIESPELGKFIELPIELTREIAEYLPDDLLKKLGKTSFAFYSIALDTLKKRIPLIKYWSAPKIITSVPLVGHTAEVSSVAFSPNGQLLASAAIDNTVRLWNVKEGKQIASLPGRTAESNAVAFSHDGKLLAYGSYDETIRLLDIQTLSNIQTEKPIQLEGPRVRSIIFAPDGTTLASSSEYSTKCWDITTGNEIPQVQWPSSLAMAFSSDSKIFAAFSPSGYFKIFVLNRETDGIKKVVCKEQPVGNAISAAFSPDFKVLAVGIEIFRVNSIKLINVQTGNQIMELNDPSGRAILAVAFSPDGKLLATGTPNGIRLWDIKTKQIINQFPTKFAGSLSFSHDGRTLAAGYRDGTVLLLKAGE